MKSRFGFFVFTMALLFPPVAFAIDIGSDNVSGAPSDEKIAIGRYNITNLAGQGASAIGYANTANGNHGAIAHGYFNQATGVDGSVAIGDTNHAPGNHGAVAIGAQNRADGDASIAIGANNTASGDAGSVAMGYRVQATAHGSQVIGSVNLPEPALENNRPRSLMVGFSNEPTLYVDATDVGVNTDNPQSTLHVKGSFQFENAGPGAPSDVCDNDKKGKLYLDISNTKLYICFGTGMGWRSVVLE